jgi:hypothetical protein
MGRFYTTTQPTFLEDNMYQAPIELMAEVIGTHEARTDELMAKSELLDGITDQIQHLNFEAENERVRQIQNKYDNAVNSITDKILENPLDYQKHAPALKALQKEMLDDRTTGEWYQVEKRLQDYQTWLDENKDMRENNPTLFNRLNNHYYNDVVNRATEDANATFQGQRIIDRPDLIKGYREVFENIKANSVEQSDGTWLYKNKVLTESEVANIAWNTLLSDKNYTGFTQQMGGVLGDPGYFDEEGRPINAFNLVDGNGNVITYEQYQQMPDEEKAKVSRQLNPNNAFYSDLSSVAQTYGFTEQEQKADPYGLATHKGRITSGHIQQRANNALQLEGFRQQGRMDLLERKYELMGEQDKEDYKNDLELKAANGDEGAKEILQTLEAKETIGVLGNPTVTLGQDLQMMQMYREQSSDIPDDGRAYFTAVPGTAAYGAQQRWKNASEYGSKENGETVITLSNGTSFKAQEYYDWLGTRKHSEDLSREFLEKKGIYVKDAGGNTSEAQGWANNARWTPNFMKSDAAEDWDKIYEVGEAYETSREEWYTNYSEGTNQISLQPINDVSVNRNMMNEVKTNAVNYYMVDADGELVDDYTDEIKELPDDAQVYVLSANTHGQMGMEVEVDGESYYIFPNQGNDASSNVMVNLSLQGVDPTSQYYNEMTNRISNNLIQDITSTGENSVGSKSIVTRVNGKLLSLELVGDQVYVRHPDAGLNSDPEAVFENMQHFVNTMYATE